MRRRNVKAIGCAGSRRRGKLCGIAALDHRFVGERYLREDNTESLPAYRITSAALLARMTMAGWKLFAKGEVSNLFDSDYEVFRYYPMPKRNYRMTISVEYAQ